MRSFPRSNILSALTFCIIPVPWFISDAKTLVAARVSRRISLMISAARLPRVAGSSMKIFDLGLQKIARKR